MSRAFIATLMLALSACALSAQTVLFQADLAPLGVALGDTALPIDADGNAATAEWVILRAVTSTAQVVAISANGAFCLGAPFALQSAGTTYTVETWFGRSVLLRRFKSEVTLISLARPPC